MTSYQSTMEVVMPEWDAPLKVAETTEYRLLDAILDGTFPVDSQLPAERDLAEMLGVTRPTLRKPCSASPATDG